MSSLYIQINILLAAAWIVFQLLPKRRLSFRAVKSLAQTLLLSALLVMPVLALLPDNSFPDLFPSTQVRRGQDFDAGSVVSVVTTATHVISQTVAAPEEISQGFDWPIHLWQWLFLAGVVAMAFRCLWGLRCLGQILRDSLTLHRIGRTTVAISERSVVPFSAWHLGQSYVVLPASLLPYRKDFRIALRHEIEHHRRRDTLWTMAMEGLVCGFYLNPAIYLWRKSILQLQELACDEALISRMGISQRDYGSCLLRVAEMALERRFMYVGTTCMILAQGSNGHSFLTRRINMFAQHERSTAKKAAAIVLGTVTSLCLFTAAYFAQAAVRSGAAANPGQPVFDSRVQLLAEGILRKGLAQHQAKGGFAIVADPERGTVIATASVNLGFDANLKGDWALSYPFEPGSALKPLLIASALQHKNTRIDEIHNCENGKYRLGRNLYNDVEAHDKLSTADTVAQSSNICTIKIAEKMGATGLESGLRDFGLGGGAVLKNFPAARAGHVPSAGGIPDENYIGLVSHGIGNRTEFHVTPLEMVQAYSAIANGGRLMKAIELDGKQEAIREVLSPQVAEQMRGALRRAVEKGTAQSIKSSSIPLAGKTSTVMVDKDHRLTGFIGYAPADNPKLVVYVVVIDPKGEGKFGSNTAAPIFREIVEKAIPLIRNQKVSLNARQITTAELMKRISESSGLEFIVSPGLRTNRLVSLDVKNANLTEVLDFLAMEQNARWEIVGNTIRFSEIK